MGFWDFLKSPNPPRFDHKAPESTPNYGDRMALIEDIEDELAKMKAMAAEGIEKPAGKYRIIKTDHPEREQGYFVQTWRVGQMGYKLFWRDGLGGWEFGFSIPKERMIADSLDWTRSPFNVTYIEWHNVGSDNPHSTYEDAEEWLRKWLRPEVSETFFNESGEIIAP